MSGRDQASRSRSHRRGLDDSDDAVDRRRYDASHDASHSRRREEHLSDNRRSHSHSHTHRPEGSYRSPSDYEHKRGHAERNRRVHDSSERERRQEHRSTGNVSAGHRDRDRRVDKGAEQSARDRQERSAGPSTSASQIDPTLDFFSAAFDALKALHTPGLQPPNPRVRPLDTLRLCRVLIPDDAPDIEKYDADMREPVKKTRESQRAKLHVAVVRAKAAQEARKAPRKHIFDEIAEKFEEGPLSLIYRCYKEQRRVRVVTRHTHGVRGSCVATIIAFDKYLNMVLSDVCEEYSVLLRNPRSVRARKKQQLGLSLLEGANADIARIEAELAEVANGVHDTKPWEGLIADSDQQSPGDLARSEASQEPDDATEVRYLRKLDYRKRHLKQVFLRGDSVVMVMLA
eukprot:jgi/Chlat1/2845/Chrsp194S03009